MRYSAPSPVLKNARDTVEVRKAFGGVEKWAAASIFGEEFGYKPDRGRFIDFSNGWAAQEEPKSWTLPIRDVFGYLVGGIRPSVDLAESIGSTDHRFGYGYFDILNANTGIFNTICRPDVADGASLGDATYPWSDLHLAQGGTINWDNGDVTLTQAGDYLYLGGASQFIFSFAAASLVHRIRCYSDTTTHSGIIDLFKSASDTLGTNVATANGDIIGSVRFYGNDGANFTFGAEMRVVQTGAASTETPSFFLFYTSTGTAGQSVMQLSSGGEVIAYKGFVPDSDSGAYLGTTALGFSGLSLALSADPGAVSNRAWMHSRDSSVGAANATLALRTEQAVEAIGTFTATHKLRIWINNVEYWIQLDTV